ncbi:hypothetical protein [Croceicoccus marinus]|nr:hypothetical protein [Croceicoccus marinus]
MRDWLTDEERANEDRNAWKLKLEATVLGTLMLYVALTAAFG